MLRTEYVFGVMVSALAVLYQLGWHDRLIAAGYRSAAVVTEWSR